MRYFHMQHQFENDQKTFLKVCGNLLCLLEILLELPENLESSENSKVSVHWLIQRMCKEVNIEVIKNHQCTLKVVRRSCWVFVFTKC